MDYRVTANTDVGIYRQNNQDSLSVKVIKTKQGRMVFAVLCDGMGGLSKGEVASASVIKAFDQWLMTELPSLCNDILDKSVIYTQWNRIAKEQNELIKKYGKNLGLKLGTTAVVMLLTQTHYYILNIGDSRAYVLNDGIIQITRDHSLVAREIERGNLTLEEAKTDKRRHVLLQCIGVSGPANPDFFSGNIEEDSVYMLCSDGFRNRISEQEMYMKLRPEALKNVNTMQKNVKELIELNKQRNERDNISVVLIRTV